MSSEPVVLYVEDDPSSRKLMSMLLRGRMKLPYVTILEDSTDFLAHVEALDPKPDVVFLDIHVKPYDGFEMLEMLRRFEWAATTPIIALTASVMNEEIQKLGTAGFNGCIAKPIDLDSFPETLECILNGEVLWRIAN
jgi:two-component system, cell cycle response regulator